MQNGGRFNDIGHYHMHIFPRYNGNGFGWCYNEEIKQINKDIVKIIKEKLNKL